MNLNIPLWNDDDCRITVFPVNLDSVIVVVTNDWSVVEVDDCWRYWLDEW